MKPKVCPHCCAPLIAKNLAEAGDICPSCCDPIFGSCLDTEPSEAQLERMNASAFAAQEKRVLAEDQTERDCRNAGRPTPFRP